MTAAASCLKLVRDVHAAATQAERKLGCTASPLGRLPALVISRYVGVLGGCR